MSRHNWQLAFVLSLPLIVQRQGVTLGGYNIWLGRIGCLRPLTDRLAAMPGRLIVGKMHVNKHNIINGLLRIIHFMLDTGKALISRRCDDVIHMLPSVYESNY